MSLTLPMVLVTLVGLIVVLFDAFRRNHPAIPWITAVTLAIGFALEATRIGNGTGTVYYDMVRHGGMASYVNAIVLGSGLLSVLLIKPYLERIGQHIGEVYSLLLFAITGMMLLGSANHLITVFV